MSTLGNIVSRCIASVEVPGKSIKIHHAVEMAIPMVLKDPEITVMAVRECLTVKCKAHVSGKARRALDVPGGFVRAWRADAEGKSSIEVIVPRQGHLFDDPFKLKDGYSLEDAVGEMVRTRYAVQREFRGFIRIRAKQHAADAKHIALLRNVDTKLAEFWDNDPEMTYEEACALYVRHYGQPDLPDDSDDESED